MVEIFAPNSFSEYWDHKKIFLAGSIEQGAASPWQKQAAAAFKKFDNVAILNPRRPDWDSTWKNVASDKNFRQQVEWELDGLQACVALKKNPNTKEVPIIIVSGISDESDIRRARKIGVADYFVKPIDIEKFIEKVKSILG